jgi:hypothetical protein
MARPTGPVKWANTLLNNGPQGGPSRTDPSLDRQENGWAYGDMPDYETLNGWMYNVYQLLEWVADSVDGGGGSETEDRELRVETGFSFQQIQDLYDSIGKYIKYDTIITVIWEDGTYNFGANKLSLTDYSGGGLLISRAENATGAGVGSKNVTITGTGARAFNEFNPYSNQSASKYLVLASNCNYCLFGDIEFILTGTPTDIGAAVASTHSTLAVYNSVITNSCTTGSSLYGALAFNYGVFYSEGTVVQAPTSFGGISAAVGAKDGGTFSVNSLTGSADYGYRVISSIGHVISDGISSNVSDRQLAAGKVYFNTEGPEGPGAAAAAYITSRGFNANGNYRIWSDGKIEQWGKLSFSANIGPDTVIASAVPYPINFLIGVENVSLSFTNSTGTRLSRLSLATVNPTLTSLGDVYGSDNGDFGNRAGEINWYAIGQ